MKIKSINGCINFDNGVQIFDYHDSDCCEDVFADFDALKDEVGIFEHDFNERIQIERVEDSGFRLEGFFVPCYNIQNGYYSDKLELNIRYSDTERDVIDITGCTLNGETRTELGLL